MHNSNWSNGMHDRWDWIPMVFTMLVFLGGLIWLGIILSRHNEHRPQQSLPDGRSGNPDRPSAHEVLADRLARGEIDPDDYRARLDALEHTSGA